MRAIVKGVVIGILGLAWLLVPVGYVHAVPKKSCDTQRYIVCSDGTCGTRNCTCSGKTLTPGDICSKKVGTKTTFSYCDGCTGKMTQVITPQPTLPQLTPKPPAGTLQKSP